MSLIVADRLAGGSLRGVGFELEAGLHALLASPPETSWLVDVLSGTRRPRGGTLRVAGKDPYRNPALRRKIGCLLEAEPPLVGRTVRASLTYALETRQAIEAALGALGLGAWLDRRADRLTPPERRSVALASALAIPDPAMVVLWEPFAHTTGVSRKRLLELLAGVGARSCVVCATSSVRDALALEGAVTVLSHGGVTSRSLALATELAPGNVRDYVVRTERARDLAAALVKRAEVVGVDWDGRAAPRTLHVRGKDTEQTARVIVETARTSGIALESMIPEDPSLQLVQSASQGAVQAAYEQGYRTMAPPGPPPIVVPTIPERPLVAPVPRLEPAESSQLPGTAPAAVPLGGVTSTSVSLGAVRAPTGTLEAVTPPPAWPIPPSAPPTTAPNVAPESAPPDEEKSQ